ncbi:putative thyroid hormone receptor-associated protein [Fasciola gigantica]|uniref:Putative thyroid hormone receptor-associated protein n=1 Tax=Fasciola gigantica TaxID=46835 RepID=A0A504YDC8_FASGI|nr:putative thyroid hormone receptor-associated protein [Fasciola gigantica]
MSLSSLIVCLTLSCPSAVVWNYIPPESDHVYLRGSPLDLIPYSLVALPLPPGPELIPIRKCLTEVEEIIITRGRLAELRWNRQAATNTNGEQTAALAENAKKKPRVPSDPTVEWTAALCGMLKRILAQIGHESSNTSLESDWDYLFTLLLAMYDMDMADHWEVLVWLVKRAENITEPFPQSDPNCSPSCPGAQSSHDSVDDSWSKLRFLLRYLLHVGCRFTENELISCHKHKRRTMQPEGDGRLSHSEPLYDRDLIMSYLMRRSAERSVRLLDILDRQDYNVAKQLNPTEALFSLIFKDDSLHVDTGSLVTTLCEWAVSNQRFGIHRAIIVACLLEQLWSTLQSNITSRQLLQDTLVAFLDTFSSSLPAFVSDQAPVDNESMKSLVCLFGELIDRQLFDHDAYVRHFIARGAFNTTDHPLALETNSVHHLAASSAGNLGANTPNTHSRAPHVASCLTNPSLSNNVTAQHSVASEMSEENDRCSMDNPDSVRSELGFPPCAPSSHGTLASYSEKTLQLGCTLTRSPHFHFLTQFPIPQGECYAHEQNQRYQLLYGSVRARDRARSRVRHLVRDISKLFTKKSYLFDAVQGEMCKRKRNKDREKDREQSVPSGLCGGATGPSTSAAGGSTGTSNLTATSGHRPSEDSHSIDRLHDDILSRFVRLSYHDMECVISQCTPTFVKMLSGSSNNNTNNTTSDEHNSSLGLNNPPSPPVIGSTLSNTASNLPVATGSFVPQTSNISQTHIYMPVSSSIFLFFDLIEMSLNITCLISTVIDTLERLKFLLENRTQSVTQYRSDLCLRAIGILQRYQPVMLTMGIATRLFSVLIAHVFQVKESTQCSSFERCILAYLHGLFSSSYAVRSSFTSFYGKAHSKVSAIFRRVVPGNGNGKFEPNCAASLLEETSQINRASFPTYAEDLRKDSNFPFSFVCRAIVFVCQAERSERLDYLCDLCVELSAQCSDLSSEWIGSLNAILAPRSEILKYEPLVNKIKPTDVNMYDNLSSLIATLLSRHCFPISDFLQSVICAAMAHGLNQVSQPVGPQLEPIIRLACHILHRLFTAETTASSLQTASNVLTPSHDTSVGNANSDSVVTSPPFRISEPLLLTGALQKVSTEVLVDVLKMLMVNYDKATYADAVHSDECVDSSGEPQDDDGDGFQGPGSDLDMDDDQDSAEDSSDPSRRRKRGKQNESNKGRNRKRRRIGVRRGHQSVHSIHFIVQRYLEAGVLPTVAELRGLPLSALIQLVIREICTVSWVRERFCGMPSERLICENVLIDKNFSHSQARRLLHTIFYPYDVSWSDVALASGGLAEAMCHVLSNLNLWTLRCAQMKFQLLYAQIPFSQQSDVLGFVAQCLVSEFQRQAMAWLTADGSYVSTDGSIGLIGGLPNFDLEEDDPVWLLPALIQKLPKPMKNQIVKATLETLKGIRNYWKHKNDEDKESVLLQHSVILAHPAFFSLLQICLQEADPMEALNEQIEYFVPSARETEDRVPDNLRTRQVVQECLRLRLTLVGQRFQDLRDNEVCTRLALLLTQLISHGVTEPESNSALFFMVLDMLQTLVHTVAARSGLEGKFYQTLVKRLRRELSERPTTSGIEQIRPLLIPMKAAYTVFVTGRSRQRTGASGAAGSSSSGGPGTGSLGKAGGAGKSSGNKGSGKSGNGTRSNLLSSIGSGPGRCPKKRGFMIIGKERFAPWDIQDPGKQSVLLSMHGATLTEALLSRTEEQANRLIRHDHFIRLKRPMEFYLNPVYPEKGETKGTSQNGTTTSSQTLKRELSSGSSMLPPSLGPQISSALHSDSLQSTTQVSRKHGSVGHALSKIPPRSFGNDGDIAGIAEDSHGYLDALRIGGSMQQEKTGGMHPLQPDFSQEFPSDHSRVPSSGSTHFGPGIHVNIAKQQYATSCGGGESMDSHIQSVSQGAHKPMDAAKHGPRAAVMDAAYGDITYPPAEGTLNKVARNTTKFATDPSQITPVGMEISSPYVSTTQPTTTKRKRGAGRRAPSVSERALSGNAALPRPNPGMSSGRTVNTNVRAANSAAVRIPSVGVMDAYPMNPAISCSEKLPDMTSTGAPPNSWQELCATTVYVQSSQPFDGSMGIPHSLGATGPTTSYGDNTVSFVSSFPQAVDNMVAPVRQQAGNAQNAPRYMSQLAAHRAQMTAQGISIAGSQSQQPVPNPPPYPVSQSGHPHLTHHQQSQQQSQHVIGRSGDDNYVLMIDTTAEEAFGRAGGQPTMPNHMIPRQTSYQTMRTHQHLHPHHTQQQQQPHPQNAVSDQVQIQMMPQYSHGVGLGATFQRISNPGQLHAPPRNTQNNQPQTHYPRFTY